MTKRVAVQLLEPLLVVATRTVKRKSSLLAVATVKNESSR